MITFPIGLFKPSSQRLGLVGRVVSGPPSFSGIIQNVATSGGGLWALNFGGCLIHTRGGQAAWEALDGLMDGGATKVIVPVFINQSDLSADVVTGIPFSDTSLFSDGVGWSQGSLIATAASAALRATKLTITFGQEVHLIGGEKFGLDHLTKGRRMYKVVNINAVTGEVTIRPPLREAITGPCPLDFTNPSFEARLVPGEDPAFTPGWFASTELSFVEAL